MGSSSSNPSTPDIITVDTPPPQFTEHEIANGVTYTVVDGHLDERVHPEPTASNDATNSHDEFSEGLVKLAASTLVLYRHGMLPTSTAEERKVYRSYVRASMVVSHAYCQASTHFTCAMLQDELAILERSTSSASPE